VDRRKVSSYWKMSPESEAAFFTENGQRLGIGPRAPKSRNLAEERGGTSSHAARGKLCQRPKWLTKNARNQNIGTNSVEADELRPARRRESLMYPTRRERPPGQKRGRILGRGKEGRASTNLHRIKLGDGPRHNRIVVVQKNGMLIDVGGSGECRDEDDDRLAPGEKKGTRETLATATSGAKIISPG